MKECFKCKKQKPLDGFYKHSQMADGHLNKCKECAKIDAAKNYYRNWKHYQEYEIKRFQNPERKNMALKHQRNRRNRHPEKYNAYIAVRNAIRSGKLIKQPCSVCKNPNSQAHHTDYSNPLDVIWLCRKHHLEKHGKIAYEPNPQRKDLNSEIPTQVKQ